VLRSALLLAFDHHRDIERKLTGDRLERAAGFNECHRLALVVAGAARDDDFASAVDCRDARFEWRRLPKVERVDGLHVIMAVEQDTRSLAIGAVLAFADHHRMPGSRPQASIETEAAKIGCHILGGVTALHGISRIRRNRLNSQ